MSLAKSARVEIRVTDAEKAAWADAAGGQRKVSEWLRSLANAAAFKAEFAEKPKLPLKMATSALPQKGDEIYCSRAHFHRPGTYCGSCKTIPS